MKIKSNLAISDSGFIFNPSTGDSFSTNPIGLEIIRYFNEGLSAEEIKKPILKRYDVNTKTFDEDLKDFLAALHQLKLTAD